MPPSPCTHFIYKSGSSYKIGKNVGNSIFYVYTDCTPSPTPTNTPTPSITPPPPSVSATSTLTPTVTPTITTTPSRTPTLTPTRTATPTPNASVSPTPTRTPTPTPSLSSGIGSCESLVAQGQNPGICTYTCSLIQSGPPTIYDWVFSYCTCPENATGPTNCGCAGSPVSSDPFLDPIPPCDVNSVGNTVGGICETGYGTCQHV